MDLPDTPLACALYGQSAARVRPSCAHVTRGGVMEATAPRARPSNRSKRELHTEDLIDYCSRPNCRKEFRWAAGPGRRQAYCSEMCRRAAEKELRQTRASLARFEAI